MSGHTDNRFLLWVDAVGGFLVCCGEKVVLGQAAPGNVIDVPIQGDLARRHAIVCRDQEGYTLAADAPTRINGVEVRGAAALRDGALVELGPAVKFRFRLPHPLSCTASLLPVSHHRTRPAADGVLLLAESCLLGPGAGNHIVARNMTQDVLLFRQAGELRCRSGGMLQIDDVAWRGEGPLTTRSRVCGDQFSLTLEKLD